MLSPIFLIGRQKRKSLGRMLFVGAFVAVRWVRCLENWRKSRRLIATIGISRSRPSKITLTTSDRSAETRRAGEVGRSFRVTGRAGWRPFSDQLNRPAHNPPARGERARALPGGFARKRYTLADTTVKLYPVVQTRPSAPLVPGGRSFLLFPAQRGNQSQPPSLAHQSGVAPAPHLGGYYVLKP